MLFILMNFYGEDANTILCIRMENTSNETFRKNMEFEKYILDNIEI